MSLEFEFENELFNPLYWHLKEALKDENIRFIFLPGGSSAAKTYSICQALTTDSLEEVSKTMILRKYGTDIEDSIFSDFKGIINEWDLDHYYNIVKNKITNSFGSLIRFRGLDDSEKVKGISKFKKVVLEELSQFEPDDLKQIRKRLRGLKGQQIIGIWNPISEEHWIKKDIIDPQEWEDLPLDVPGVPFSELGEDSYKRINKAGNTLIIKTTYKSNYWIVGHPEKEDVGFYDKHTIEDFEADKVNDYNYYRVYALGEWGKLETGAEFYKAFNPAVNVGPTEYNPNLPLRLSFDENVNPYMACTIWQTIGKDIQQIDEICLETPQNTLTHTITEFKKRYPHHQAGVIIYGDATSQKADVKLDKGETFFTLITSELSEYQPQTRLARSNPSPMMRGLFINDCFSLKFPEIRVTIGENCKNSIEDANCVKEGSDGRKHKEKIKNKNTGVTYEKYGHTSDTMDYFLCEYLDNDFREFMDGGRAKKRIALKSTSILEY